MERTPILGARPGRATSPHGADASTPRPWWVFLVPLMILVVLLVAFASREPSRRVTRAEFGPAWPLTLDSAVLTCAYGREITVTSRGTTYSLNGPVEHGAYDAVGPIWADAASGAGKADLAPLIDAGMRLCDE